MCLFFLLYFPPIYTVLLKESWAEIFLPWIFSAVIKLSVEEIWTQFGRNKDRVFWYIGPQLSIAWKGCPKDFFEIVRFCDWCMSSPDRKSVVAQSCCFIVQIAVASVKGRCWIGCNGKSNWTKTGIGSKFICDLVLLLHFAFTSPFPMYTSFRKNGFIVSSNLISSSGISSKAVKNQYWSIRS